MDIALYKYRTTAVSALDAGETAVGLFVDFSRAFDCVNHTILLYKLEPYEICGVAFKWFVSYLTGRKQRVKLGMTTSHEIDVAMGVPQGSILGPTLFAVFVNDMFERIKHRGCAMVSYADDTNILIRAESMSEAQCILSEVYRKFNRWVLENK